MKRNTSRKAEEAYLAETLRVVRDNVREYGQEVAKISTFKALSISESTCLKYS